MHSEAVIILALSTVAYCDLNPQYKRQTPSQYGDGPGTYASVSEAASTTSTLTSSYPASTALSNSSLSTTSSTFSSSQSLSSPSAYSSQSLSSPIVYSSQSDETTTAQSSATPTTSLSITSSTATVSSTTIASSIYSSSSNNASQQASQYSSILSTATESDSTSPTPYYTPQPYTYAPIPPSVCASSCQSVQPSGSTLTITYQPSPVGSGTAPASGRPISDTKSNGTCDGATLNVLGASLDWWYPQTVYDIVSTYSQKTISNTTEWGLAPVTTSFDLTSALTTPVCTYTATLNTYINQSVPSFGCSPVTSPVAAATTVITQTAFITPNATTGTGTFPSVLTTPAPAAITVPSSGGNFSQGTPFVYFSAYEIMTKYPTTSDGKVSCAESTHIYNMSHPFSFEYTGPDPNGELEVGRGVTGDVASAFLSVVNQTSAAAGSWVAAPTVVLVVQKIIATKSLAPQPFVITPASTVQLPSPTLPGTLTPGQPGSLEPIGFTGHVESSQGSLDLPTQTKLVPVTSNHPVGGFLFTLRTFIAHVESSQTTLVLPTPTDVETITTNTDGETLTATALLQPESEVLGGQTSSVAPFVGQSGSHTVTLAIPANPSDTVITASWSGGVITATRLSVPANNGGSSSGGNGGALASAIISAAQPTNAVGVLTNAENTFSTPNPTAGAILSGIGGGVPTGSNGNNGQPGGGVPAGNNGNNGQPGGVSPIITAAGSTWTAQNTPAIVVGGQTVRPGSPAVTVDGHTISAPAAGSVVVIDGSTVPFSGEGSTVVSANGVSVTEAPEPVFTIGSQTLLPGGAPIVVSGTTFSLAPGGTAVVVNGNTQAFLPAVVTSAPLLTVGNTAYAPNAGSTYDIDGSMLTPGGVITVDGSTISLGTGSQVVINGVTQTMGIGSSNANVVATITAPPALTIDGQTISPNGGTSYIISGQTLTPGGEITITQNGVAETISLSPDASTMESIVSGQTMTSIIGQSPSLPSGALLTTMGTTYAGVLTIGGETFTATASGDTYVIDGQTLTPGEQETVTIDGKTYIISLASDATVLEIETEGPNGQVTATSFETLLPASATRGTVTNTVDVNPTASAGAALSGTAQATGTQGSNSSVQSGAFTSATVHLGSLFGAALFVLALAVCL